VRTRLLERDAELALIDRLIEAARKGRGGLVLVEGPPGIGKTRLVEAARERGAGAGLDVLAARGAELEASFPFGVVRRLFERRVADAADSLFAGAAASARAVLAGQAQAGASFDALHGLYWLTANLSTERPLLLAVDDAHWADPQSQRFIAYLAPRIDELPVVLVMAQRVNEPAAEAELLDALRREPAAQVVTPQALGEEAVGALAGEALGAEPEPAFVAACQAATGGNPFLVTELLVSLRDEGMAPTAASAARLREVRPATVAQTVLMRVGRLEPPAVDVARALAILGPGASLRHAAALAGVGEDAAARAADELMAAGVLQPGFPLDFVHPLVRAAIHDEEPPAERAIVHRRAAELLVADRAPAEDVAAHLLEAAPAARAWSVDALRDAAREALGRGAPDAAARYLRRALDEPPDDQHRAAVLRELGEAELRAAEGGAAEHLAESRRLIDDPIERARIALGEGRALMLTGRLQEGIAVFDTAAEEVAERDPELAAQLGLEIVGAARFDLATRPQVAARLDRLRAAELRGGPVLRQLQAHLAFEGLTQREPLDHVVGLAREALDGGELLRSQGVESPVIFMPVWSLVYCDLYEEAGARLEPIEASATERGSALAFSICSTARSVLALRRGAIAEALAAGESAIAASPAGAISQPLALAALIEADIERGELESAEARLAESGLGEELPNFPLFTPLLEARGWLWAALGRRREAIADLRTTAERGAAWGARNPTLSAWRPRLAEILAAEDRADESRPHMDEALTFTTDFGAPRALGITLREEGLLTGNLDRLHEAVAILAPSEARLEHARALVDLGSALRRANRRADAREPLREGMDLAHRCGASALVERAREELAATGVRPRRPAAWGAEALTATERRIASMAANGMSNPEIAQALFVSRRTVETHLGRVYRKLDVSGRDELADRLREADPWAR
jgi:DNA-binding CsgD family transcriptional regulator